VAYCEIHAQRLRDALRGVQRVSEKRMMGGLCLLVNGNMVGGIDRTKDGADRFMFRIGVDAEACTSRALPGWVAMALGYVKTLPRK
jgi:hypothetical protein